MKRSTPVLLVSLALTLGACWVTTVEGGPPEPEQEQFRFGGYGTGHFQTLEITLGES